MGQIPLCPPFLRGIQGDLPLPGSNVRFMAHCHTGGGPGRTVLDPLVGQAVQKRLQALGLLSRRPHVPDDDFPALYFVIAEDEGVGNFQGVGLAKLAPQGPGAAAEDGPHAGPAQPGRQIHRGGSGRVSHVGHQVGGGRFLGGK